jgi:hypothetical protein
MLLTMACSPGTINCCALPLIIFTEPSNRVVFMAASSTVAHNIKMGTQHFYLHVIYAYRKGMLFIFSYFKISLRRLVYVTLFTRKMRGVFQ